VGLQMPGTGFFRVCAWCDGRRGEACCRDELVTFEAFRDERFNAVLRDYEINMSCSCDRFAK